jgi:hypothetical protein
MARKASHDIRGLLGGALAVRFFVKAVILRFNVLLSPLLLFFLSPINKSRRREQQQHHDHLEGSRNRARFFVASNVRVAKSRVTSLS